jgi:hypothetical protein
LEEKRREAREHERKEGINKCREGGMKEGRQKKEGRQEEINI